MAIAPGTRLGPYEILSAIGAGGMGEVYEAHDTTLGRSVAIKVLPEAFAHDAERLARFQREAKLLAALNHPNIATIHGLEQANGTHYLVMELVAGETLADRIKREGPVPTEEALPIARQIAEALEAAHEKGIIHRDLKPANVKVTPEGKVKVLDFGLAKAFAGDGATEDPSNSPTLSAMATVQGVILGTAAYMSPEQARGKTVDKRTDLWAFGCVLYEMLTGKQAFQGEDITEILAAVVKAEPDWNRLPPSTPAKIGDLLHRCLQKDRSLRMRDVGDARIEIAETLSGPAAAETPTVARAPRGLDRRTLLLGLGGFLSGAAIAGIAAWDLKPAPAPAAKPLTRLNLDLGPEAMAGIGLTVAISPDGRRIVFPERGPDGKQQLATRTLDQAEPTLLSGTEGGSAPFFSPDGQWIGFFAGNVLKKISVQGGAPVTLASVNYVAAYGASWGKDGYIVTTTGILVPLFRIPAAGGTPQPFTKLGPGEVTHRWPQVLPGGNAVLFTASPSPNSFDNADIKAVSLRTGQVEIVQHGGYYGRYLPNGYLVYVHQGTLFGAKFDPERLEESGAPVPLLEDVTANPTTGGGQFDFSKTGTFVYAAGKSSVQAWQVAWLGSSGKMQPLLATPSTYAEPRLSPDGRKLAYIGDTSDIYLYDPERGTTSRLTFTGRATVPLWAPDGKHLVYKSGSSFYWIRSDGSGNPQLLLNSANTVVPWSFSPDGRNLAYHVTSPDNGLDIWTLPLNLTDPDHPKPGKPEPFLRSPANELVPRFSPDGRWIAYRSDESGDNEIYVRPFPVGKGGKWQISSSGGLYALWSKDGRELFYESADSRIMVVDYTVNGTAFVPGKPRVWSDKQLFFQGTSNLDLAPDSKRFVVFKLPEAAGGEKGPVHMTMLLNFFDEVKRKIP